MNAPSFKLPSETGESRLQAARVAALYGVGRSVYFSSPVVAALMLLAAPACKKKELEEVSRAPRPVTEPAPPKASPEAPSPAVPVAPAAPTGPVQAKRTVLDAEVRKIWKSVEFVLREKKPASWAVFDAAA